MITFKPCSHPWIEDLGEKWTFCEDVGCDGYIVIETKAKIMPKGRTPAERIALARNSLDNGAPVDYAIAHALIAIAEILCTVHGMQLDE